MGIEQKEWKQEITKQDLPYQVIGKYFGAKNDAEAYQIWQKKVKENKDWLRKMSGDENYTGTAKQNITIADRLRKNDVEPFYDYQKNSLKINDFNEVQKMYQSKNLSDLATLQYYITNLDDAQIAMLNSLPLEQRVLFIIEQCQNVDQTQGTIQTKVESGGSIENKNLAAMKELLDMQEKLEKFIQKYSSEIPMISRFKRKEGVKNNREGFIDETTEKEFEVFYEEQKSTAEYKKIVEKYGEIVAEEQYRQLFIVKNIDMSSLSEEAKREFADIIVNIYEQAKKFGIDLVKMGFDTIYKEALKMYQFTDMYTQLSAKVMSDPEFNTYFDKPENRVEYLVSDDKKDLAYYKNLIKLYPEIDVNMGDGTKLSENFQYLNDDMSIKEEAPETFKNSLVKNKQLLMENVAKYEKKLLDCSNAIIQQSAIEQCLTALQHTMNIEVDEGENLLEQLTLDENLDAIVNKGDQLLLKVKGTLNGKQIALSYDLVSGKVYYQKYMQKAGFKDTDPIVMGSSELQEESAVPFITLPTLGNIIQTGKNMDYMALMKNAKDVDIYEKNLEEQLQKSYQITENISHEVGQEMIKKNILEDMIIQKMINIGDRTFPIGQEITKTQYPSIYDFYNYLYRSFAYYAIKPMVHLENWNNNLDKILLIKEQSQTTSPEEIMFQAEENKNQERLVLYGIVNQKVMGLDATETKNQVVEKNLLAFFQCFEKDMGGMKIIDVEMMNDFFRTATRNGEEAKLGKWVRNDKFNTLYHDFSTQFGGDVADLYLQEQIQSA